MGVRIGPCRIADSRGTYEPGDIVEFPTSGLLELAQSKMTDPETGIAYCAVLSEAKTAAAIAVAPPTPEPEPTPAEPAPEKT